jgi:hypothetical protein
MDRAQSVKRMIASGALLEGVLQSLYAGIGQDPAKKQKLDRNPTFISQMVDGLLDRLVPFFEGMSDEAIAQATAFQESIAGQTYALHLQALVQGLPAVATAWMEDVVKRLDALP